MWVVFYRERQGEDTNRAMGGSKRIGTGVLSVHSLWGGEFENTRY